MIAAYYKYMPAKGRTSTNTAAAAGLRCPLQCSIQVWHVNDDDPTAGQQRKLANRRLAIVEGGGTNAVSKGAKESLFKIALFPQSLALAAVNEECRCKFDTTGAGAFSRDGGLRRWRSGSLCCWDPREDQAREG